MKKNKIGRQNSTPYDKYIYAIALCMLFIAFSLAYSRYKMENETQISGDNVRVPIRDIVCSAYEGGKRNYIVILHNRANHIVNVGSQACLNYKIGDSVSLLHNIKHDLYYTNPVDSSDSKWGAIIFGIFFCIIFLNMLFPNIVRFPAEKY